ncbi:MAG: amidohydrolase [Oscillospiraceae bacterium]|nr:amidohydrolase [Oscillospiraceae bacterium]
MDRTEKRISEIIEEKSQALLEVADYLYGKAEIGYHETETAAFTAKTLREMGLEPRESIALTGVRASAGNARGPSVAVIGELDGIPCAEHPFANPQTGVSHACGHHAQLVAMLGAAFALSDPEVSAELDGRAVFFAVPAEEYLSADIREGLYKSGKVKYSGGKSELVRLGEFDDIDIALTTHVHMAGSENGDIMLGSNATSGFIGKTAAFLGKAAHAAAMPHEGINALNAASLGLSAVGMIRETFREKDYIRVHPVITKGGDAVNVVPHEAVLDMMVRAKTLDAIGEASVKVNRAFEGAAHAIGARVGIKDTQGYMPVIERAPDKVQIEAAALLGGVDIRHIQPGLQNPASTDVGDLTHLMPVLNFTFGGAEGALHSRDFTVTDPVKLIINPAKLLAFTVYRLLRGGAKEAKALMDSFTPEFTKDGYISYIEKMHSGEWQV